MTGRESLLNYMDQQRAAGVAHRTIQFRFGDSWDGRGSRVCVWCGKPLPKGKQRQRWCSQKCVAEFKIIKGDMGQIRHKLRAREKEICEGCNMDLRVLAKVLEFDLTCLSSSRIPDKQFLTIWERWQYWFGKKQKAEWDANIVEFIFTDKKSAAVVKSRMILEQFSRRSLWQADHILAVEDGGSGTDLSNFQLLCTRCHLSKTNSAKACKAQIRKEEMKLPPLPAGA